MVDLHTHSTSSDGELSPADLIREAAAQGLSAVALTDHDTINGIINARNEAALHGIRFIPGIELEIHWEPPRGITGLGPGGEFHLLGLGIGHPSPAFLDGIAELARRREERNREILEKMRELGVEADYEEIRALSGGHSVGRPHFASLLVKRKIVRNRNQAFARYLGAGKPFYVPKGGLDFEKAAALIRESGGLPVLAHPMSLYVAWGRLPDLVKSLQDRGLGGIEAWHPTAKVQSCRRLEELGKALGLYITAGSDFHGSLRPERRLGITAGGRRIEDSVLEAIGPLTVES
ncbi:MAG: PHP domain-containing protein [Treponema sp.]|nr:PHP domain-containing protein [Treponema sp.]